MAAHHPAPPLTTVVVAAQAIIIETGTARPKMTTSIPAATGVNSTPRRVERFT
jgi:hypothetical protein